MDNLEIEKNTMPVGESTVQPQQPVEMPTPAPMQPQQPVEAPIMTPPVDMAPPVMQQPQAPEPVINTIVAPIEATMQPIDLSGQGMQSHGGLPEEGGNKKKIIIIIAVIVVGLLVGLGAFLFWRTVNTPEPELALPIVEDVTPVIEMQEVQPIVALEADDISVIEKDLNAFNIGGIDAELQVELNAINAAL